MPKPAARTSAIPRFYERSVAQRARLVADFARLSPAESTALRDSLGGDAASWDKMVENVVGGVRIPLGVATYFRVNGKDVLVPMAVEEPSVIAAASHAAKIARAGGGFKARADEPVMIGQVALVDVPNMRAAEKALEANRHGIAEDAEPPSSSLRRLGGGTQGIAWKRVTLASGKEALIVHLHVDVRDAMGANAVNTRCERVAPLLERLTGGTARLRILSNFADRRLARAEAIFPADELGGPEVVDALVQAYELADADPYRAVTHNKGALNGIDAVVVATGNDWRACEAGAHAWAARTGRYRSLTTFEKTEAGDLLGRIELPLALGITGGATKANAVANVTLKILGAGTAQELAGIVASVGLAQNLAAMRALVTEGIQKGHMRLHERMEGRTGKREGKRAR